MKQLMCEETTRSSKKILAEDEHATCYQKTPRRKKQLTVVLSCSLDEEDIRLAESKWTKGRDTFQTYMEEEPRRVGYPLNAHRGRTQKIKNIFQDQCGRRTTRCAIKYQIRHQKNQKNGMP